MSSSWSFPLDIVVSFSVLNRAVNPEEAGRGPRLTAMGGAKPGIQVRGRG